MRIDRTNIIWKIILSYICIYILMRPFLISYISVYCKYIFLVLVLLTVVMAMKSSSCTKTIGYKEIILLLFSYIYILLNAFWYGGLELITNALSSYILYTFPILVFPYIISKIKWINVLKFLTYFGVVDAGVSIVEYITRQRLFPKAGNVGDVNLVTSAGTAVVRTYGIQGSNFILAEIMCLCGLVAWYLYRFHRKKIYLICWIIISVGVLTTGSRGYYVAYFFALMVMYFCEGIVDSSRKRITTNKIIFGTIISAIIILLFSFVFFSDIDTGIVVVDVIINRMRMILDWTGDSANSNRIRIWKWAIEYWKQSWVTGHGACCTELGYSHYISVTESGVLKRFVELGIVGTFLQYATMIIPITTGIKRLRNSKCNPEVLVAIGIIIAYLIEDLVLQRYTCPEYTIILWFAIAYFAYGNKTTEEYAF